MEPPPNPDKPVPAQKAESPQKPESPPKPAAGAAAHGEAPHGNVMGAAARISIERLKETPLFAKLPDGTLNKLQLHVREEKYPAGTTILRAGSYNPEAYYIAEGLVEIRMPATSSVATVRPSPARAADPGLLGRLAGMLGMPRPSSAPSSAPPSTPARVATPPHNDGATVVLSDMPVDLKAGERAILQPGETFGESSAISRYPVSTDVVAVNEVRCLLISSYALTTLLFKQAALADFKKSVQDRYKSRTLSTHLRQISVFKGLSEDIIRKIIDKAELVEFDPEDLLRLKGDQREEAKRKVMAGVRIAEQGTPGDALYLIVGGHVKVAVRSGNSDLAVTYLRKGDFAGELCLLMDEPWPFSLWALEHVEMVKITRADVQDIISRSPDAQRELWNTAVKRLKQRGFALRNPQASRQLQMAMDTGLIHGESVLLIDLSTCTRCDDCVKACADTHGGQPRFVREGLKHDHWNVIAACYQCTDPVCMVNCPTGAITRALGTLEVTINDQICVGCEACAKSCPWDNIVMVPNQEPSDFIKNYSANKNRKILDPSVAEQNAEFQAAPNKFIIEASKCDLCVGRSAGPACVQVCPHGSAVRVSFKDLETVAKTLGQT